MRAWRRPLNRDGFILMLRASRADVQTAAIAIGSAAHLTRHAATSPAETIFQNSNQPDLFWASAEMRNPVKAPATAMPEVKAIAARPKDGSWCSALASGGPTARAPHAGQPTQRSAFTVEPQAGQIIKCK